jgi:hypothetical protein
MTAAAGGGGALRFVQVAIYTGAVPVFLRKPKYPLASIRAPFGNTDIEKT